MNTYLSLYAIGLVVWINTALFFISQSALSGAIFLIATLPLLAVCSLKALVFVNVKFNNEV